MTTTAIQSTDLNGSSRMPAATDAPWWKVRGSLAIGLMGSFALAAAAFSVAGMVRHGWTLTADSLTPILALISATPTLAAISVAACFLMVRRSDRPLLQVLCAFLAFASLAGAGLNIARQSYGQGALERWVDKAILDTPEAPVVRAL
jgi:hypothetical protein